MKNLLVLVNPYSGDGKGHEAAAFLSKKLTAEEWHLEIIPSEYKGYFTELLRPKDLSKYDLLVVIGGDGTMHEVINGLFEKTNIPPVFLFPCGTGNAFNHDIECLDWDTAIEKIQRNQKQKIDVYRITPPLPYSEREGVMDIGFNVAGWGLVSEINLLAEKLRWLGGLRYSVASLIYIFKNPKFQAKITVDDRTDEGIFSFVLICNNKHTGNGMKMAPFANFSDGLLDVLLIRHLPFYKLLMLFPKIFSGKHIHSKLIDFRTARKITVESSPLVMVVDGEIKCESPFELEIIDKAIEVVV